MSEPHATPQSVPASDGTQPRCPGQAPPALLAVQASLDRRDNGGDGAAELAR